MPLIQIFTNAPEPAATARDLLLCELSRTLAESFQKPEQWVMTCLIAGTPMTFGGTAAHCCFATVRNVGHLTRVYPDDLSPKLCSRLAQGLGVAMDRVYVEFVEAEGWRWGWNGETFG